MDSRAERIGRLVSELERKKLDALLLTDLSNIRYLTGFSGTAAYLLVGGSRSWLFTDSRYKEQALEEVRGSGVKVRLVKRPLHDTASFIASKGKKRLGFEGGAISFETYEALRKALKGVSLESTSGLVEEMRLIKGALEIDAIRAAAAVVSNGFKSLKRSLVVGKSEKEVGARLEASFKKHGADALSFDSIVASGARSALAHGKPTSKIIKRSEFVVVDAGVELNGYNSDMTRTYVTGRPSRRQKQIYDVVRDAHDKAIEKIRPGIKARIVDRAAREHIRSAGFGACFGHGTGHGVGLKVHEAPVIGPRSEQLLVEGMVFTIEPGIYVPGFGGVRLEDMVAVTPGGCELITDGKVELRSIG